MSILDSRPITVLLVDHHRCVLWGLAKLIESARPQLELAGVATCHSEALAAMEEHRPHVVLLDLDLGSESGFDLLPSLASQAAVLILTGVSDPAAQQRAVIAGARGVIHKSEPAEVVLKAIARVYAGEVWLDRAAMASVLRALSRREGRESVQPRHATLTAAERRVVAAVVRHKSAPNKVIAAALHISEHTLRNHLSAIYGKLGISRRLDLVFHAMEHQLSQPSHQRLISFLRNIAFYRARSPAHHLTVFGRPKKVPSDVASVIGSGVSIEGVVYFSGVLRVDGTVRGKISASPGQFATLNVGAGGRVDGDVAVTDVVVHGTLNGVVTRCGNLELASTARVTGHLYYASIDVSPGAIVEAQLVNRATSDQAEAAVPEPSLALARP